MRPQDRRPVETVFCTVMLSGPARKAWGLGSVKVTYSSLRYLDASQLTGHSETRREGL